MTILFCLSSRTPRIPSQPCLARMLSRLVFRPCLNWLVAEEQSLLNWHSILCLSIELWNWLSTWVRLLIYYASQYEHLMNTTSTNLFLGFLRFLPKRSWNQWWTKWRTFLVASRIRLAACPVYRLPRKTKQQRLLSQKTRNEHNFNTPWLFPKASWSHQARLEKFVHFTAEVFVITCTLIQNPRVIWIRVLADWSEKMKWSPQVLEDLG